MTSLRSRFFGREEWDEENRRREQFNHEFNLRWEERQEGLARGEVVEDEVNLDWVDALNDSKDPPAIG